MSEGDNAGDDGMSPQAGKGKRELSTSKRAAQNRAAQRAFRQRKEGYIKKLEEQVKDLENMESGYRALQNENYQLREYILSLQSRILETSSEFPAAPSHINLHPGAPTAPSMSASASKPPRHEPPHQDGMSHLRAAAAQASEIRQSESSYGLAGDYAHNRARADEAGVTSSDTKPAS
nr:putative transcription factor kapc [Quercus suber]